MMTKYPRLRKAIAIFLLLNMVNYIAFPLYTWALTSGPTAPEYSSFEPVDTTDMVDLKSGDFTYATPLFEIPGPSGSYPMTLAYHAGIRPDQESTWVGLGWTLNPGAINRTVNGYADDNYDVSNFTREFWAGGESKVTSVGINFGFAQMASVTAGVTWANDTYKGVGVGGYIGASAGFKLGESAARLGINASVGISPYGGAYASAGIGVGVSKAANNVKVSSNIGLNISSANGINGGVSAGVSSLGQEKTEDTRGKNSVSFVGGSISSDQSAPSLSIGGGSANLHNSKAGKVSTFQKGFSLTVPVWYGVSVSVSRQYTRYWIDETENIHTYGSLFSPDAALESEAGQIAYDIYDIDENVSPSYKPSYEQIAGTYANYDNYFVSAQGVGGTMRPYHFRKKIFRQNIREYDNENEVYKNRIIDYAQLNAADDNSIFRNDVGTPVEFRFENEFSNRYTYMPSDIQRLANGSIEEYDIDFSDSPITGENGNDGIQNNHLGGSRHIEWYTNEDITNSQIPFDKGFIETTSLGFVRDSNKQIGGFDITNESGITYHYSLPVYSYDEFQKNQLVNEYNGLQFNSLNRPVKYAYAWLLTSVTGPDYVDRGDPGFDSSDWGYWVDFQYGKWADDYKWRTPGEGWNIDADAQYKYFSYGKKELYYLNKIVTKTHTAFFEKSIKADGKGVVNLSNGGFGTIQKTISIPDGEGVLETNYIDFSTPTLKLDKIYLADNEQIRNRTNLENWTNALGETTSLDFDGDAGVKNVVIYHGENVLEGSDLDTEDPETPGSYFRDQLLSVSSKVISFAYDYSLQDGPDNLGVPNSYDPDGDTYSLTPDSNIIDNKQGKLTLTGVEFLGKAGASVLPPVTFNYDQSNSQSNPVYNKDYKDVWGFYKSDFDEAGSSVQNTSEQSANNVDAWSLRTIDTSLGSKISVEYESDIFTKSVLNDNRPIAILPIGSGDLEQENYVRLRTLEELNFRQSLINSGLDVYIEYEYHPGEGDEGTHVIDSKNDGFSLVVSSVSTNSITVYSPVLYSIAQSLIGHSTLSEGGIEILGEYERFGGGLRVKTISVENSLRSEVSTTKYAYEANNGRSSGVTSYDPSTSLVLEGYLPYELYGEYNMNVRDILNKSREVPAPGVLYEFVNVYESVTQNGTETTIPYHSQYNFEVFNDGMVGFDQQSSIDDENVDFTYNSQTKWDHVKLKKVALKDYTSNVGNLKSVSLYNDEGQIISKTINNYLADEVPASFEDYKNIYEGLISDKFSNLGVIQETFANERFVWNRQEVAFPLVINYYDFLGIVSKKEKYPSILTGTTEINYKNGSLTSSERLTYDFYSGNPTKVLSTDAYGNSFVSETVPAYKIYPGMGLKINGGANMLSQVAATTSYKVNSDYADNPIESNRVGLLSSSVQTWDGANKILGQNEIVLHSAQLERTDVPEVPEALYLLHVSEVFDEDAQVEMFGANDQYFLVQLISWLPTSNGYAAILIGGSQLEDGTSIAGNVRDKTVYRKRASYSWVGTEDLNAPNVKNDGTFDLVNYNTFTAWLPDDLVPDGWQKNSEVTLYDPYSHALEAMDINGQYAATKMDNRQEYVYASVANASYDEFAYSGAEDFDGSTTLGGGVTWSTGDVVSEIDNGYDAHTGDKSLDLEAGNKGFTFSSTGFIPDKTYRVSVWSTSQNCTIKYSVNGGVASVAPQLEADQAGNWYLLSANITIPASTSSFEVYCEAGEQLRLDDFRVHPIDAAMTSYAYSKWGEVEYILNANNLYTRYEYDDAGRLKATYAERVGYGEVKVSEHKMNYGKFTTVPSN